ncbi:MAG TPA: ABC transporter ATP-binding protein [Thermoleophilaceae bacterium]|nr:ABC transporter ATP-binding protein [Thermoleophilaceae bacterium]
MSALLEVEDLEAGYGAVTVLRGVSLQVGDGQVVGVLGPNGAGKTTMLRALSGVVRPRGHVRFAGDDVAGKRPEAIARLGIAQVPEGRGTFTGLTVRENLQVGALSRRDGDVAADIDRCFERFPVLGEREDQAAGSLSGGEQQMLAVARALMLRPKLLLLDEPSLGLAPKITAQLFSDLSTVARDEGTTVLLVEQNASLALKFADYAYVLEAGQIALSGTASELADDDQMRRSYLGV